MKSLKRHWALPPLVFGRRPSASCGPASGSGASPCFRPLRADWDPPSAVPVLAVVSAASWCAHRSEVRRWSRISSSMALGLTATRFRPTAVGLMRTGFRVRGKPLLPAAPGGLGPALRCSGPCGGFCGQLVCPQERGETMVPNLVLDGGDARAVFALAHLRRARRVIDETPGFATAAVVSNVPPQLRLSTSLGHYRPPPATKTGRRRRPSLGRIMNW